MVNTFELQAFLRTESDDGALVSDYNLTPVEMLDKHTNMKIMAHIFSWGICPCLLVSVRTIVFLF